MAWREYNYDKEKEMICELVGEAPEGQCVFCGSEYIYKDNMCHKHFTQFNFFKHIWNDDLDDCVKDYLIQQVKK